MNLFSMGNFFLVFLSGALPPIDSQSADLGQESQRHQSLMDRLNKVRQKALRELRAREYPDEPRKIKRGAVPELILIKDEIFFNSEKLKLGEPLTKWKKAIGSAPRCFEDGIIFCVWDDYGLEIGTGDKHPGRVKFINIHISFDPDNQQIGRADYPDGRPAEPPEDDTPHRPFTGYLEFNDVGIDAKTEFWEVQAGRTESKSLRCGILDCSHPRGAFGEHANIGFVLDGRNEHGRIKRIGISYVSEWKVCRLLLM